MSKKISSFGVNNTVWTISVLAVVIALISGWLWWEYIYQSPRNVFWGMLSNNLATPGITRHTVTPDDQPSKLDQYTQLSLGQQNLAHSVVTVSQTAPNGKKDSVTTETIGATDADYVRYTNIQANSQPSPKALDPKVLQATWGKTDLSTKDAPSEARMLGEGLIGTVPQANLSAPQRQKLLELMRSKNVYNTDYRVQRQKQNGRTVYVYDVKITPSAYVALMQTYLKEVGKGGLAGVSAADYQDAPALTVEFTVDPISRQLLKIQYQDGSGRQEHYSSYGMQPVLALPTHTVPISELQKRLQQAM